MLNPPASPLLIKLSHASVLPTGKEDGFAGAMPSSEPAQTT